MTTKLYSSEIVDIFQRESHIKSTLYPIRNRHYCKNKIRFAKNIKQSGLQNFQTFTGRQR